MFLKIIVKQRSLEILSKRIRKLEMDWSNTISYNNCFMNKSELNIHMVGSSLEIFF